MTRETNAFSYPVMLKLEGKKCVIIGGGVVAARKLATLCQAKARVTVIAPSFAAELKEAAANYSCTLITSLYEPEQLEGAFLVVAATDSFAINRDITNNAPCLCNNITEPELSNFTVPSSIVMDTLTLTVATGGMPAYTRLLKRYLQQKITPAFSELNAFLLEQRQIIKTTPSTPEKRTSFWRQTLNEDILTLLEQNNIEQAKEQIKNAVDSFRTKP